MIYPTLLLNAYAHPVHKSILKEYGLPHTVAEWYVCREHESLLKEYGLPHTVLEWYVRCKHESLLKEYSLPHNVAEWYVRREHEVLRSALHVALCTVMSETQDRLQKRKNVCKQFIYNQMVTFYKPYPLHL